MAAQDLQIRPRRTGYLAEQSTASRYSASERGQESSRPSLLVSALQRRWWLFLLIGIASLFAAREAMQQFGKESSRSTAALIQTGLPASPEGGEVIKPMAPVTCSELIKSHNLLTKLCDARGLELSPKILQEMLETKTTRGSSRLLVEFAWSQADEGVAMLNELLDIFVEDIATQRKRTLRAHMQHVENALLESRSEVADARQQILEVQAEHQKVLEEGGLNSERYKSILASVTGTQLGVDEKRIEQLGVLQQIEVIQQKSDALKQQAEGLLSEYKTQLTGKVAFRLKRTQEQLTETSVAYEKVANLITQVEGFAAQAEDAPLGAQQWQVDLYAMLSAGAVALPTALPTSELDALTVVFETQLDSFGVLFKQIDVEYRQTLKQQEQLELSVIPLKNQIKMLEARLADYRKQAEVVGDQLMGIGADQYGAYELRLEQAENQQKALSAQLENMSQLEKCRVNEWSISEPASLETTEVSSNHVKLFALAFGLCGLVLSVPVFASEWYRQQDSPQIAFANSLHLPVLAERILKDFAPRRRQQKDFSKLSEKQLEVVRMLALRIQQSSHTEGSVVLFSSIDSHYSPAPLMASVAECLAQREEKVLIIDAICPDKSRLPITNVVSLAKSKPEPNVDQKANSAPNVDQEANSAADSDWAEAPGLSEFLISGKQSVSELLRPTGCQNVDLISSGHSPFPREALASSSLTDLVEQCREKYTMILVNSPAATASADLQMLTARADGVVLMATKEVRENSRARAAVVDLIELGAPIIGVVA